LIGVNSINQVAGTELPAGRRTRMIVGPGVRVEAPHRTHCLKNPGTENMVMILLCAQKHRGSLAAGTGNSREEIRET
jgi:hypothetical protein